MISAYRFGENLGRRIPELSTCKFLTLFSMVLVQVMQNSMNFVINASCENAAQALLTDLSAFLRAWNHRLDDPSKYQLEELGLKLINNFSSSPRNKELVTKFIDSPPYHFELRNGFIPRRQLAFKILVRWMQFLIAHPLPRKFSIWICLPAKT